jgi:four helix bundle protein
MADTPPFAIRFKQLPSNEEVPASEPGPQPEDGVAQRHDRAEVYQQALDFAARAFLVLERAEAERFYLRDQLDRKSAIIPQLVAQGLATGDMKLRRAFYTRARQALTDCAAVLDILAERGIVPLDVLEPARSLSFVLLDKLLALTVPPPRVW